jgi:regulator of replication initiation timing
MLSETVIRTIVYDETADMRGDIETLKQDVSVLKDDVAELKTEVRTLQIKFEQFESKLDTLIELVTSVIESHRRDIREIKLRLDRLEHGNLH